MTSAEYLVSIITPMVKHPHCINVSESQDQLGVLLSLNVHKDDMGTIIGKKGETAKCIRTLVKVVGFSSDARVSVKINEPKE